MEVQRSKIVDFGNMRIEDGIYAKWNDEKRWKWRIEASRNLEDVADEEEATRSLNY